MNKKAIYKSKLAIDLGFKYDEVSGVVTSPTGKSVSSKTVNGYLKLNIRHKEYNKPLSLYAHQFAFYVSKKYVPFMIDHINRDKEDNRIINLRPSNKQINGLNNGKESIFYCKRSNKFLSIIMINGRNKQFGSYETREEAIKRSYNVKKELICKLQDQLNLSENYKI